MLNKIKQIFDPEVRKIILIDNDLELLSLVEARLLLGSERVSYKIHKGGLTTYMMELSLPNSKFEKLIDNIKKFGYNLKTESKMNIVYRVTR